MGDLDYSQDEILSMDVTLKYDWATLNIPGATIGGERALPEERLQPRGNSGPLSKIPDSIIGGGN